MARMKVWDGRKFLGSFDLDSDVDASETLELPGDPPEVEFRWTERSFVEAYRLHSGNFVIHEVDIERVPSRAAMLSQGEAVDWFASRGYEVPNVVKGRQHKGTKAQQEQPSIHSTRKDAPLDSTEDFTQSDIDSLVRLRKALLSFESASLSEFLYSELYPEAIGALTAFAIRAPEHVIDSAARVSCQSATCLSRMGYSVLSECQSLGIDSYADWLQESYLRRRVERSPFGAIETWISDFFHRVERRQADPTCEDLKSNVPFDVAEAIVGEFECRSAEMDAETAVRVAARGAAKLVELGFGVGVTDLDDVPFPTGDTHDSRPEENDSDDMTEYRPETSEEVVDAGPQESEPMLPDVNELAASVTSRRRQSAFFRDFYWLGQRRADGLSVAQIRDAWNRLSEDDRYRIAKSNKAAETVGDGDAGWNRVSKGINAAYQDLKSFAGKNSET